MKYNDLLKFKTLIKEHQSANHPLFDYMESLAIEGSLTEEMYSQFSINIATRTMLSLPEIHACCIQASLDLDPLRTAYSVMTGAEEGGFGEPSEVHTILMMNALNYHGKAVFALRPLNLKYFMSLIRLLYSSRRYACLLKLESTYPGVEKDLQLSGFVDKAELIETCHRMAFISGIEVQSMLGRCDIEEIERIEHLAYQKLIAGKVLKETIDYCLAQLIVLGNMKAGYLQGVGFAHEGLADGMINKLFRILYASINKYSSPEEFMKWVYPYFAAHGNYIEVYNDDAKNAAGVEVTHAQREFEKLSQLDTEALETAWAGANDFANRNFLIWEGIMKVVESLKENENHVHI